MIHDVVPEHLVFMKTVKKKLWKPLQRFFLRFKRMPGILCLCLLVWHLPANFGGSSSAWALVEFDSFQFTKQKVKEENKKFKDQLDLGGTLLLGSGNDGLDLTNEAMTVTIRGMDETIIFTQTIPPGSFKSKKGKSKQKKFEYKPKKKNSQLDKIKMVPRHIKWN